LAESENAKSEILKFDIPAPNGEIITEVPTEEATPPIPTNVPTVTPTIDVLPTTSQPPQPTQSPGLADWVIAIMISSALAWSSYRLAALIGHVRWGVRIGFLTLIGGLLAYCYLILEMPGSQLLTINSVSWGVVLASVTGAILGLLVAFLWRALSAAEEKQSEKDINASK